MNKNDLIEYVADCARISLVEAERAIDCYLDAIRQGLRKEQLVHIPDFGSFSVSKRTRSLRTSKITGREIVVKESILINFKPDPELKKLR